MGYNYKNFRYIDVSNHIFWLASYPKSGNTLLRSILISLFFTEDGDYILKDEVDRVNSKAPINRDKYDKDILTVDERVNICFTIYNGDIFRFFPLANDQNNTWYTARENSFFSNKDSLFVTNIMLMYMNALDRAMNDNNWATCDSVVSYISSFQYRYGTVSYTHLTLPTKA